MARKEQGYTQLLARHLVKTTYEDLPEDVVHQTKRLILDTVGCALGGYPTDMGWMLRSVAQEFGGKPESTIVGSGEKTSCANAAYVNARMANILDADDTFNTETHFGTTAVFAPLSICERNKVSGKEFITAVALGFDLAARVAVVTGNPYMEDPSKPNGDRYSLSETMVFSAVGGAAKALGIDEEQTRHAIGIAGANTPIGTKYTLGMARGYPTPNFKYGDYGWCALGGVIAAFLAQRGFTSFPRILDRDSTFWDRFVGIEKDFDLCTKGLGKKWHIMDTTFKPWPSCRWTHPPLTAFTKIIEENNIQPEEIEKVTVYGTPAVGYFVNYQPQGMLQHQFNIPHPIAMAAFRIPPGPEWFSEKVMKDPKILAFRNKVSGGFYPKNMEMRQWIKDGQWRKVFGKAEVVARGRTYVCETEYMGGDPWSKATYFTDEDIKRKFRNMASPIAIASEKWQHQVQQLIDMAYDLENVKNVTEFTASFSP